MKTAVRELEERIVRKLIRDVLASRHKISVSLEGGHDIEDMLVGSMDEAKIMEEAFSGDECHLFIQRELDPAIKDGQVSCIGWVYLVLGNEGWDVISDYTSYIEPLLSGALEISNQYC